MNSDVIIQFWFTELTNTQHFAKSAALDARIRDQFEATLIAAIKEELTDWRKTATGRLAEIIVLDQFSRNIYRGTPASFAQDPQALARAQELVSLALDEELTAAQRAFAYMPYMHSESLLIHEQALALFSQPGLHQSLKVEHQHLQILERFGRYPHRNAILSRPSTEEEIEFLKQPGSSF